MSGFLNGSSAAGAASGDLSGSFPSPVVVAIRGITVPTPSGSNTVLTYNAGAFSWGAGGGGGGITALTGDVTASGTGSVAATVVNIHGASVPVAGSLTTGNILQVSGASALSYGALNLAGGSNYVTNALPIANVAPGTSAQILMSNGTPATTWTTLSGDMTVSATGGTSVVSLTGAAGSVPIATTGNILTWAAGTTAPGLAQTAAVSGAGANMTIAPQDGYSGVSGSLIVNVSAPASGTTEAGLTFQRGGSTLLQVQALVGTLTSGAIYSGAVTPSASNYMLTGTSSVTALNAPSASTLELLIGNSILFQIQSGSTTNFNNTFTWGTGQTPTVNQTAKSTDAATQTFTLQAQNAFATASTNTTGGNLVLTAGAGATSNATFISGNVIAKVNAPSAGGTEAFFQVNRAGSVLAAAGALVGTTTSGAIYLAGVTPSASNYAISGTTTTTTINSPSSTLAFAVGNTQAMQISSGLSVSFLGSNIGWPHQIATPNISQSIQTTDVAINNLTIQAQNAFATASTNITGANLVLQAGAGATSNATFTSGNVIAYVNAPSAAGTEAFFQVNRAGSVLVAAGALVGTTTSGAIYMAGVTPSASNYALGGSSTITNLNGASDVQLTIGATVELVLSSANFSWSKAISNPVIAQQTLTTDVAPNNFTINAQGADTGAATNTSGGNLVIKGGTSAAAGTGIGGQVSIASGLLQKTFTVTTATYTTDTNATLGDLVLLCNRAGVIGITLPAVTNGRTVYVKDISGAAGTNHITITPASGNVDGAGTYVLTGNYDGIMLVADGTNWWVTGEYNGTVI